MQYKDSCVKLFIVFYWVSNTGFRCIGWCVFMCTKHSYIRNIYCGINKYLVILNLFFFFNKTPLMQCFQTELNTAASKYFIFVLFSNVWSVHTCGIVKATLWEHSKVPASRDFLSCSRNSPTKRYNGRDINEFHKLSFFNFSIITLFF